MFGVSRDKDRLASYSSFGLMWQAWRIVQVVGDFFRIPPKPSKATLSTKPHFLYLLYLLYLLFRLLRDDKGWRKDWSSLLLRAIIMFETMQAMFDMRCSKFACSYVVLHRSSDVVMTVPPNSEDDKYTQFGSVGWRLGRHMMNVGVKDSRAVGEG